MNRSLLGFPIVLPFYNTDGFGAGGDGSSGAGGGDSTEGAGAVATPAEPQPIEVDPDTHWIKIKGQDKPIKFSEYGRNFQAQATRASQEAARLKQQIAQLNQEREQLRQQSIQRQGQPGGGQNPNQDVFADLAKLPYLNGEQAAGMARSIAEQIRTRDMVTLGILKQFQALKQTVDGLNGAHVNSRFESTITNAMKQVGVPDSLKDFAKELYLAYEGDDLDQEFPTILANRWTQLKAEMAQEQKRQVEQARQRRWVPGAGGNVSPSKPLQFKGNERASDVASQLWESLQESGT